MSPDYWEDALTIRRLKAQSKQLNENPPPEFFLSLYFQARKWWEPVQVKALEVSEPVEPQSSLPEYEP